MLLVLCTAIWWRQGLVFKDFVQVSFWDCTKDHKNTGPCLTRTSLILLLMTAAGAVWLLENPGSSVVMMHDNMQDMIRLLRKFGFPVFKQTFWMAHYHHPNMKLTKIWSISRAIWRLDFGKHVLKKQKDASSSTTRKYVNHKGEVRFTGTKALKKSQYLGETWGARKNSKVNRFWLFELHFVLSVFLALTLFLWALLTGCQN